VPPKPIIASDGRRAVAIAAAMTLLLLASLGGAYAFTRTKSVPSAEVQTPVQVGALSLAVPGRWSERTTAMRLPGVASVLRLDDPQGRELSVAVLAPLQDEAAEPGERLIAAYAAASKALDPRLRNPVLVKPIRLDTHHHGLAVEATLPSAGSWTLHQAFVFTNDDQRFWLAYLVSPLVTQGRGGRAPAGDDEFFWQVVATAKIAATTTQPDDE
jgi:hypothetical protein